MSLISSIIPQRRIIFSRSQETTNYFIEPFDDAIKTSATPTDSKTAYAIVIGISDYYGDYNDLEYSDDDAEDVRDMLIEEYNFNPNNIKLLTDDSADKMDIDAAFASIASQADANDVFFFFYSGHGGACYEELDTVYSTIATPHYYSNNQDRYYYVKYDGADAIDLHFTRFETEECCDGVIIGSGDTAFFLLAGDYNGDFNTGPIPVLADDRIWINFFSDGSVSEWGFEIDYFTASTFNGTQYICPRDSLLYDSYLYLDSILNSKLDSIPCNEKYVILDSCNSGGMIPEIEGSGVYMMSASQYNEFSLEDEDNSHGLFSHYFLEAPNLSFDINRDGVLSFEEYYDYIYPSTIDRSKELGFTFHPQESDGILGESVLKTAASYLYHMGEDNQITYYFNMYGTGELRSLNLTFSGVSSSGSNITGSTVNLYDNATTATGFERYSGSYELTSASRITSYRIQAQIYGYHMITIDINTGVDFDHDLLGDNIEIYIGLDPDDPDSDNDGLIDGMEYYGLSDPFDPDSDDDGLLDGQEIQYGTNPIDPDSDDDGTLDGLEFSLGLNPLDPKSSLFTIVFNIIGTILLVALIPYAIRGFIIYKKKKAKSDAKINGSFKVKEQYEGFKGVYVDIKTQPQFRSLVSPYSVPTYIKPQITINSDTIQSKKICKNCGGENDLKNIFCTNCGGLM
ncbi:MAG: caspase family protein [Candidatus Lokiarchaeota archaeon]|nr:caspase family protein [Candidatus Lokiarchaeota archaeon]